MCHSTVSDVGGVIETAGFRLLENMRAVTMAVSGTRKVACVVCNGANFFYDTDLVLNMAADRHQ